MPVLMPRFNRRITSISADGYEFCTLDNRGQVSCRGQVFGSIAAFGVPGLSRGRAVDAGGTLTCLITDRGGASCFRGTGVGLGDGETTTSATPVPVAGLSRGVTSIAANSHACAMTRRGQAWCWGGNDRGQLGDGTTTDSAAPVRVVGF